MGRCLETIALYLNMEPIQVVKNMWLEKYSTCMWRWKNCQMNIIKNISISLIKLSNEHNQKYINKFNKIVSTNL